MVKIQPCGGAKGIPVPSFRQGHLILERGSTPSPNPTTHHLRRPAGGGPRPCQGPSPSSSNTYTPAGKSGIKTQPAAWQKSSRPEPSRLSPFPASLIAYIKTNKQTKQNTESGNVLNMDDAGKTDPHVQSILETRAHSCQGTPAAAPPPPLFPPPFIKCSTLSTENPG